MSYEINFYDEIGSDPIVKFIKKCDHGLQAKILKELDLLENYGLKIGMPHLKKITKDLYELRVLGKVNIRLIFTYKKENFYILHIFKKKSNKTPIRELNVAINRLTNI